MRDDLATVLYIASMLGAAALAFVVALQWEPCVDRQRVLIGAVMAIGDRCR